MMLFFCIFILESFPRYNSIKSTTNPYPSFLNNIPPVNLPFVPPPPPPPTSSQSSSTISVQPKRSIPSNRKRPRLTAQLRNEILQLRANRPTIFVWEIQQTLIENGICTPQTLPHVNSSISGKTIPILVSNLSRRQSSNEFSTIRWKRNRNPMRIYWWQTSWENLLLWPFVYLHLHHPSSPMVNPVLNVLFVWKAIVVDKKSVYSPVRMNTIRHVSKNGWWKIVPVQCVEKISIINLNLLHCFSDRVLIYFCFVLYIDMYLDDMNEIVRFSLFGKMNTSSVRLDFSALSSR